MGTINCSSMATTVYVSPNGTGAGGSANDPAYFKDVLHKIQTAWATKENRVDVYFMPGTYDFEDASYSFRGNIYFKAADNNNWPVFTRSVQVSNSAYLFHVYDEGSRLGISRITFDKWSAGRGDTDTDIPACARAANGGLLVLVAAKVNASKFSGNSTYTTCFMASNAAVVYLAGTSSESYKVLEFNSLGSTAPSGSQIWNIIAGYNGGVVKNLLWGTSGVQVKAGALGQAMIVIKSLQDTGANGAIGFTFDNCYRLVTTSGLRSATITVKQEGYNADGTVDNTAVGGTDFKVYNTLFDFEYSGKSYVNIILNSDVFCESHFLLAQKSSGHVILSTDGNTRNINSTASGNSSSNNSAIHIENAACFLQTTQDVVIGNTSGLKFYDGIKVASSTGSTTIASSSGTITVSGRNAAMKVSDHGKVYGKNLLLTNSSNGLYLPPLGNECTLVDTNITNNTTGINVTAGSKVTTNNITFSGNTNNYNGGANVAAATAKVRTT